MTEKPNTTEQILGNAGKDTGFTKGGGFTIKSETIKNIVEAIKTKGYNLTLSPKDFGELIEKDVSKSKNPVSSLQTAFNKVVQNDYKVFATKGLKASIRRNQGADIKRTVDGKEITEKEGLIALCMEKVTPEN